MKHSLLFALLFYFVVDCVAQPPAQTIPVFDFYKADKSAFTNNNLAVNKMVFFFFFDPTCEHCQQAMSVLDKNFQDYKKAAVYLISTNDHQTMQMFIDKYAPGLKNQKNITFLQDSKNEFIDRFKPIRYPSMFLYSPTKQLLDYEDNENSMFRFIKYLKQS